MTDDATLEQTLTRVVDLARTTFEAQTSLAKQSIELGRAAITSEIDTVKAGRTWLEAVGRETGRYWSQAGALGVDLAGELVSLGTKGMSRVMTETQQAARRGAGTDQQPDEKASAAKPTQRRRRAPGQDADS